MIRGTSVRLRAMGAEDAESLWRWNHDPEVMRWMENPHPQTLSQVRDRLAARAANAYDDLLLGVEALADGVLIGLVALREAAPEKGIASLDIYLGEKEYWGRGHATDAMRTVCRYGFGDMRLHKIELTVVTENHAARRVYEKVGFMEEGRLRRCFRRDGQWYDRYAMGLFPDELR
ncbi:GNAT family N-acetyltransferase [Streptomyces sp. LP05-1]|uniref:GNAT family N-acetyltransferase n=1 Tax=Streptomyces pyxinae TaxID=2970734 RepID=A0ABT2CDM4_9ACTN|nr:GNAT family N-acetyltransferase [Streptomyces sp. LP05-1]MCS0635489.1 GNAT family N-acetyltransferase [Streptomyces sp. LP05-1]